MTVSPTAIRAGVVNAVGEVRGARAIPFIAHPWAFALDRFRPDLKGTQPEVTRAI